MKTAYINIQAGCLKIVCEGNSHNGILMCFVSAVMLNFSQNILRVRLDYVKGFHQIMKCKGKCVSRFDTKAFSHSQTRPL